MTCYGTLSFAGARRLEQLLSDARGARQAIAIVALRGRTEMGSTFFRVLHSYARTVRQGAGRVLLAEVSGPMCDQLWRTRLLRSIGRNPSSCSNSPFELWPE